MEEKMDNENQIVPKAPPVKGSLARTLSEDMTRVIENDKSGLVRKIITEQEEKEVEQQDLSPQSQKNRNFMFIGIILIFLSMLAIIFVTFFKGKIDTVPVDAQFVPIIFTDKAELKEVDGLKKEQIVKVVTDEVSASNVKVGGVEGLYLTLNKKVVGLRSFLDLIKANTTLGDIPFVKDNFLIGVENDNTTVPGDNKHLFILLKVRSFADVFDAMKSWESKMFYDLGGFFGVDLNAETNYLLSRDFEDGIMANKNARILKDTNGGTVLMYVYLDDTSVLITNSDDTTKEIILRLAASQVKK